MWLTARAFTVSRTWLLVGSWCIVFRTYFLLASAASCSGAVRGAESPPHREQQKLFMFTACTRSYTHTHWLPTEWADLKNTSTTYMPALWGSLIIIAWSVIRPYRSSSPLKLRQFLCCSYIAAEKIIPSDYLVFLGLPLMLFYMGIIWKQLDLLCLIPSPGLPEHEISLLCFIPGTHVSLRLLLGCNVCYK